MIRLTLTRRWFDGERTIGKLTCGDEFVAFTMEPGFKDFSAPRVEEGFYHLVRHDEEDMRFRDTWALVGKNVSHRPIIDIDRNSIIFHSGNWDSETRGCIILGRTIGHLHGETALLSSKDAMDRLRSFLGKADAYLTIKGG